MGRRSVAEKCWHWSSNMREEEDQGPWIVLFRFGDKKTNTRFWTNINRLKEYSPESFEDYQAYVTRDKQGAHAAALIAEEYGMAPQLFKASEEEIQSLED